MRGGAAFAADRAGRVCRLDLRTGRADWEFEAPPVAAGSRAVDAGPVALEDGVVFGSLDGYVYALDSALPRNEPLRPDTAQRDGRVLRGGSVTGPVPWGADHAGDLPSAGPRACSASLHGPGHWGEMPSATPLVAWLFATARMRAPTPATAGD